MRPSGKMISALPALTASIRERTAIGFIGSSGSALVSLTNGRTHHSLRDADIDGENRLAVAQRHREAGIEEAHMIERDDDIRAGLVEIVDALDLDSEQRAKDDRQRIAERARRHGPADRDRDQQTANAEHDEQARRGHPGRLQECDDERAHRHEGGIEHVDAPRPRGRGGRHRPRPAPPRRSAR